MTHQIDYDADLARRLEARLATFVPMARVAARSRQVNGARLAATVVTATLAMGSVGLGLEINAAADSQGLSCLDAFQKVKIFASGIADRFGGLALEEQRAAKQRIDDYANSLIPSSCADETKTDLKRLRSTPIALPNRGGAPADADPTEPAPKPADRGTPKPTTAP